LIRIGRSASPDFLSRVARRVSWYPTSREKRARCGAPELLLLVQEAGHLSSNSLLMTKGSVGVPSGNWFEGSQVSNARPGAPFDFTLRCCGGHKLCHFSPDSLSASRLLRGMRKGSVGVSMRDRLRGSQVSKARPGAPNATALAFINRLGLLLLPPRWLCSVRDTVKAIVGLRPRVPFPLDRLGRRR
jgi:hypothetical protein